jgi:potassium channel subfamily K
MNNYGNNPYDDDTRKDKTKPTSPRKSMALTLGNAKLTGAEGDAALEEARHTNTESTVGAVVKCLVAIFVYATVGWIFFNHHYGWTFVDCLYFAMVTVTTVGYGDLTPQDDPAHQLFVAMYAFLGVAIIAGFLSDLSMKVVAGVKKVAQKAKNEAIMESNALLMQHSSHKDLGETKRAQQQLRGSSGKGKKGKTGLMRDVNMVYNSAKDKFGIMVDLVLIFMELAFIWSCGAWMLQSTEGFTFVQGFYCSAITSVSVGYGDYFPSSQTGRLLFAFYIPLSVTGVLGSIHQIMNVAVKMQTVLVIKREPMTKIFTIDQDGKW